MQTRIHIAENREVHPDTYRSIVQTVQDLNALPAAEITDAVRACHPERTYRERFRTIHIDWRENTIRYEVCDGVRVDAQGTPTSIHVKTRTHESRNPPEYVIPSRGVYIKQGIVPIGAFIPETP